MGLKRKTRKGLAALILGANMPDIDVFFALMRRGIRSRSTAASPTARRRRAGHAADPRRPAVAARPLAAAARDGVQKRPADALRLAARALLPRRAHPPVARLADDLRGPAALALVERAGIHGDALFIIDSGSMAAADRRRSAVEAARAAWAREWRRRPQIAVAIVLAYIGFNLARSRDARRPPRSARATRIEPHGDRRRRRRRSLLAARPRVARAPIAIGAAALRSARRRLRLDPAPARRRTWTIRSCARRSGATRRCASSSTGRPAACRCRSRPLHCSSVASATHATARAALAAGARDRHPAHGADCSSSRSTSGMRVHNSRGMSTRGEHLVRADRAFRDRRRTARAARRAGLRQACSTRSTAAAHRRDRGHAAGRRRAPPRLSCSRARARRRFNSWMALVRLATSGSVGWYKAWTLGEWSSPDPVALFELFSANARRARRHRPRQGPVPLDQRARPSPARQCAAQGAGRTSPPTTTSATISTPPGSTRR